MPKTIRLTEEQKEFIVSNYRTMPNRDIAEALGFCETTLYRHINALGLPVLNRKVAIIERDRRVAFLEANYLKMPYKQMAEELGCSLDVVNKLMSQYVNLEGSTETKIYKGESKCWSCKRPICAWFRCDKGLSNYRNLLTPCPGMKVKIRVGSYNVPLATVKECSKYAQ